MLLGTYMGVFLILKFILIPVGLSVSFMLLLFMMLTLCVPFIGYYYARLYRDRVCGGSIGFGHAWVFTVFMYLFASMLVAVAHYVYFRFIDGGLMVDTCERMLNSLEQTGTPGMETYIATYREAIAAARQVTPIEITLQMISTNVFTGILLALPTALFVMKRSKNMNK